eukprot:EG_transcript_40658
MDLIAAPPKKEPAPPPPVKLPTLFGPEVDSLDLGCKTNALRAASLSARGPSSRTPGMPLNKPPTATPLPIRPSTCRPSDGSRRLSGSHGAAMPAHFRRACSAAETRNRHGYVPPFTS